MMWYTAQPPIFSIIKRTKVLTSSMCMNLKNFIPSKRSQTQDIISSTYTCCCCCCWLTQSCLTLCNPVDCSRPGFPVLHYLLKLAQIHVHWVGGALTMSSSAAPFFCLQSFPASGPLPMSRLFHLHKCPKGKFIDIYIEVQVQNPPAMQETPIRFLGWEDLLEKG